MNETKKHRRLANEQEKIFLKKKGVEEACIRIFGTILTFDNYFMLEDSSHAEKDYQHYMMWCVENHLIPSHTLQEFEFLCLYWESFLYTNPRHSDEAFDDLPADEQYDLYDAYN